MLKEIRKYSDEVNSDYQEFFSVNGEKAADLEPELISLQVIASSVRGDIPMALQQAKDINQRFPTWSERKQVAGAIEILSNDESPFRF
jgi:hypothetical protein